MRKLNSKGFSAVEGLLLSIAAVLVGFVGWYVWHSNQKTKVPVVTNHVATKRTTTTSNTLADPYKGWKSGKLKYEKITYKYPSNWTVKDQSSAMAKGEGCVYPGRDIVTLTSPSKEEVDLTTGIFCIGDGGATVFKSSSVKSLGLDMFVNIIGPDTIDSKATYPTHACLSLTKSNPTLFSINSKNIFGTDSKPSPITKLDYSKPIDGFCYYPYNVSAGKTPSIKTTTGIEASKDFAAAKLIFESMKF